MMKMSLNSCWIVIIALILNVNGDQIRSMFDSNHSAAEEYNSESDDSQSSPEPEQQLEPMCESNATGPYNLIQCGTCKNHCGQKTKVEDYYYFESESEFFCSCDQFCGFNGDCCEDFELLFPMEYEEFQEISSRYPALFTTDDFLCKYFNDYGSPKSFKNLMIHTCASDGSECEFSEELNEDVNTFVPMYDIHRGVHYISGQCALCNGATDVIPWDVELKCLRQSLTESDIVNSIDSLQSLIDFGYCDVIYTVVGQPRPCELGMISTCEVSCQNQELINLCESGYQSLTYKYSRLYKNSYCAACNSYQGDTNLSLGCSLSRKGHESGRGPDYSLPGESAGPPGPPSGFSLTVVFDFDPRKGLTVGEHLRPVCGVVEVYVPDEDACREITCPSGFVLDGSDCIPEPTNITSSVSVTLDGESTVEMLKTMEQEKNELENSVTQTVVTILEMFNITHQGLEVPSQHQYTNDSVTIEFIITCHCDYSVLQMNNTNKSSVLDFEDELTSGIQLEVIDFLFEIDLKIKSVEIDLILPENVGKQSPTTVDCTWLVYTLNETVSANDTITVVSTGRTYDSGEFQILEDAVIVCETDLSGEVENSNMSALDIITLVCITISIVCLMTRIVLQFKVTSFKSRPGQIQLQLAIAFLFAFVMLIIGPLQSESPDVCTAAAILLAYGFLAAFIWMNVIAVDTWLVFRPSSAFSRSDEAERSLRAHYVLGWGIPLLLVSISVVMNYVDIDDNFKPEFGGSRCWYTQRYAMLICFGVPIGLSILLNIIMFTLTFLNLYRAFNNATSMVKAEGYHFGVYVRLFILMGITWIFGFISAFTDEIVIDYIFVILNSLQGLFLFISFVFNKRVLSEIRGGKPVGGSFTSSDKRTGSTQVHSTGSINNTDNTMVHSTESVYSKESATSIRKDSYDNMYNKI